MQIKIACPAKINLTLEVLNKREDGFHNIKSIMQTISLFDYLTICAAPAARFEVVLTGTSEEIPYNEKNLVHKAILLFVERTNLQPHRIEVFIEKNIPVSAGLAGGSTDAAGTLYGLNKLFDEPLTRSELHELCAKLGSDLNFCLAGGCQLATSRGEVLEKLPFKEFKVSLIKPVSLGISAKEAYTKFAQLRETPTCENYLEAAVINDYPVLQEIKKNYPTSIMSGSGSTFFAIDVEFEQQDDFWIKNDLKTVDNGCYMC